MKTFLSKMAIVAIALTMSLPVFSQEKGDMAVGGNFVFAGNRYGGSMYTHMGVSAKARYNILDAIRAEGELTLFLPKYSRTSVDLSVNAHYLVPLADAVTVYPLAGLGIYNSFYNGKSIGYSNYNNVCFNLGGGIDFHITDQLYFNIETKIKIVDQYTYYGSVNLLVSAGVAYKF